MKQHNLKRRPRTLRPRTQDLETEIRDPVPLDFKTQDPRTVGLRIWTLRPGTQNLLLNI